MDLEEVIRELPEDVPESERRDLLDDSRDHGDTRAKCPGWPNYRAGGAVALRRVAWCGVTSHPRIHLASRPASPEQ